MLLSVKQDAVFRYPSKYLKLPVGERCVLDASDDDENLHSNEVEACNGALETDLCGPLILKNSFHRLMLSLIKLTSWRCCVGSAMLAQSRPATTIVPSYHHLLALYD